MKMNHPFGFISGLLRKRSFVGDVKSRRLRSSGFSNFLNHISRITRLFADYLVFPPSFCGTEAWPIRSYVYFCTYLSTLSGFHFAHVCIISSIGILVGGSDLTLFKREVINILFIISLGVVRNLTKISLFLDEYSRKLSRVFESHGDGKEKARREVALQICSGLPSILWANNNLYWEV